MLDLDTYVYDRWEAVSELEGWHKFYKNHDEEEEDEEEGKEARHALTEEDLVHFKDNIWPRIVNFARKTPAPSSVSLYRDLNEPADIAGYHLLLIASGFKVNVKAAVFTPSATCDLQQAADIVSAFAKDYHYVHLESLSAYFPSLKTRRRLPSRFDVTPQDCALFFDDIEKKEALPIMAATCAFRNIWPKHIDKKAPYWKAVADIRDRESIHHFCSALIDLEFHDPDDTRDWNGLPLFVKHNILPAARQLWLDVAGEMFRDREYKSTGYILITLAEALGTTLEDGTDSEEDVDYGYDPVAEFERERREW